MDRVLELKAALQEAAKRDRETEYAVASCFHLPVAGESVDLLLSVFAPYCGEEFLRVLKPDGVLVFVETVQKGDRPDYDGLLELFPIGFHEPYYADYVRQDLDELFTGAGLEIVETTLAFMSKVVVLRKSQ